EFKGVQRGYGNTIILKHHGEYTTLYAHMSRFASGIKKGQKVKQGDLIAYVGATGAATGPHLHYEFRIAGKHVDPQSTDLPIARSLEGKALEKFKLHVASHKSQLAMLAQLQDAQNGIIREESAVAVAAADKIGRASCRE